MARTLRRTSILFIIDLLVVILSFLFAVWLKPGEGRPYLSRYFTSFLIFLGIWILISILFNKYQVREVRELRHIVYPILLSNGAIAGLIGMFLYTMNITYFSRFIVFGTILTATTFELVLGNLYYKIIKAPTLSIPTAKEYRGLGVTPEAEILEDIHQEENLEEKEVKAYIKTIIINECGEDGFQHLNQHALLNSRKTLILSTTSRFNVEAKTPGKFSTLINLRRINDIRRVNKFFEVINRKLPNEGVFIGCAETKDMRKKRIFRKFWPPFNYLFYYFIDFPIKRVFPKFAITKKIYFFLTKGNNRVVSRAEVLGRLISCGFEIRNEAFIGPLFYFVAKKVKEPVYDMNPSYGPFVRLRRVGNNGRIIKVLKMRTMHPYAEYLQEYIYNRYNLENGGKFKNDFRISTQGRIMRKLWIDELPMFYNWLKGEVKIVGVRPISEQYFSLYKTEIQEKRIQFKPGLIPPYYVDLPETLEEIQESEMRYLDAYSKKPFRTDWKYFWRATYNIVFKKARSR